MSDARSCDSFTYTTTYTSKLPNEFLWLHGSNWQVMAMATAASFPTVPQRSNLGANLQ